MNTSIPMKVCKFESGLNDTERVGDYTTDNSGDKRMNKVMTCMLIFSFQIFKSTEEGVAPETCLHGASSHAFIEPFVTIFKIDEVGGTFDIF